MGEKEIKQAGGGRVVTPPPPEHPKTVEKEGSGAPKDPSDPNERPSGEAVQAQMSLAQSEAAKGVHDTLYKDGWYEGKNDKGQVYAQDPDGVRGVWDPDRKEFFSPKTGKSMPKDWGTKHKPK